MPAAKSLAGQTFGRLTVIERFGSRQGRVNWLCRCECGRLHEVVSHALTSGHTKSCGCWKDERNTSTEQVHGHARRKDGLSPTYQSWRGMWTRCTNSNVKSYKDYGARGIQVCERWKDFSNFLSDMGERPHGTTLERRDSNGNYEPSNCRWATRTEQNRNTRANSIVSFGGREMTQAEFSELVGLNQSTVSYRLKKGWTPEQVAEIKPNASNRVSSKLGHLSKLLKLNQTQATEFRPNLEMKSKSRRNFNHEHNPQLRNLL